MQTESEHKSPVNGSYFAHVNPADGGCLLEKYSEKYHDFGCALLANLFASEGQPGKVIFVHKDTVFSRSSQIAKNLNFNCHKYGFLKSQNQLSQILLQIQRVLQVR